MISGKRYTDEFKIEAVKQVTERGYKIAEVAERLGNIRSSRTARLNILKSPLAASNVADLAAFNHLDSDNKRIEVISYKASSIAGSLMLYQCCMQ
jgi:transposase